MPCEENFKRVKGCKPCDTKQSDYVESVEYLEACPDCSFTRTIRVLSAHTITVFVKNIGDFSIKATLQNSPDGVDFVNDKQILELEKGDIGYIVPYVFSKYIRLAVAGRKCGRAKVWVQMQLNCCRAQP